MLSFLLCLSCSMKLSLVYMIHHSSKILSRFLRLFEIEKSCNTRAHCYTTSVIFLQLMSSHKLVFSFPNGNSYGTRCSFSCSALTFTPHCVNKTLITKQLHFCYFNTMMSMLILFAVSLCDNGHNGN